MSQRVVVSLPLWTRSADANERERAAWSGYQRRLAAHELGHVLIRLRVLGIMPDLNFAVDDSTAPEYAPLEQAERRDIGEDYDACTAHGEEQGACREYRFLFVGVSATDSVSGRAILEESHAAPDKE